MVDAGYITQDVADRSIHEPLIVVQRALEAEAPHFVDFVGQTLADQYPGLTTTTTQAVDVYTTLDLHLQRLAQDAVRAGLTQVDTLLSKRKRGKAEAALIALDPRTGEILAFVGGRSYNQSQYNRAIVSRRQPGSVFKPFVFLAAFEQALAEGRTDVTPASITNDEQETFEFDDQVWTPENYEHEYDGPITFRRALAHSRNLGDDSRRAGGRLRPRRGVLEEARRRRRRRRPIRRSRSASSRRRRTRSRPPTRCFPTAADPAAAAHRRITSGGKDVTKKHAVPRAVAQPDTTFLVTNMMRSVLNEGTAASARGRLHARRRRQDRHDQRPARRLVRRLHARAADGRLGRLRRQPAGRPQRRARGAADLDAVHENALAGRASVPFDVPDGIAFADIDADTGKLATPTVPKVISESVHRRHRAARVCELHR
jgi:membrane carboxypeptidase/penicillin-binding protein